MKQLSYIIGRLSDWGSNHKNTSLNENWTKFREIHKKLGDAVPCSDWFYTDDLNDGDKTTDGTPVKGNNDLHYSMEGYGILAKRFAEKVIELVE